ncbi:MAG: tetratricopeptide repeat protein [Anaerolineaceae bacterium]
MKALRKILIVLLVLLPIGIAAALPFSSEPFTLLQANQDAKSAETKGDRLTEILRLKEIVSYQSWRLDVWERIGNLQFVTGNYQDSIQTFEKAALLGNLNARSLLNEGKCWIALNDNEKAKQLFRKSSEIGTADIDLYMELAQSQESVNDSIGTLATLLRAYGLAPNDKGVNYELGVQFAASQPDKAIRFLTTAQSDNLYEVYVSALIGAINNSAILGESANRFIYIGQELSQIYKWQAAASAFSRATQLDPQNGIAWALLGEAMQQNGENGFEALSKANSLAPDSDVVAGLLAVYYRRQQKYDLALTYLYKAAENNPNESTWQIEIGNTLALQGDLRSALIHFQEATLLEPDSWIGWQALASFCITYNYDVSPIGLEAARKALLLVPGSPVLLDIMGSAYMVIGDLDSAERFYLQADQASPNQAEILFHLGQLYLQKNNKALAFSYLRSAAENATDSRIRDNANLLIRQFGG